MNQKSLLKNTKFYLTIPLITLIFAFANLSAEEDTKKSSINAELRHEKVGALVERLIERSHYNHTKVNDELSSLILNNYIENLDGNRSYFTTRDIEEFEKYRYKIDDMLGSEPLQPAFEIFDKYRIRAISRMEFAIALLDDEPDFSVDENYQFDRSEESWLKSNNDLDELWRKRVKNDVLNQVKVE